MQKIKGKHAAADVFSDTAEEYAIAQIKAICDNEAAKDSKICIMPDVHPGKVGPIGLTMTLGNRVLPCLLGTDIGCGIGYFKIKETKVEYQKLDTVIRENIPIGSKSRKEPHRFSRDFDFDDLICRKHVDENRAILGLGTLGSGNHFIELDKDDEGNIYAFVHSGSRYLGAAVTEYYLREGQKQLKKESIQVPYELTYLEGKLMEDYIHDVNEVMGFAMLNREIILYELEKKMKWKVDSFGESIHNYVDENLILRKGAAQSYEDDEVIIPINMRDGIILGKGKGNPDWNYSAPHGAGRILSRDEARKNHTISEFKEDMKEIYSPSICKETLDEAPFAYRSIEEIIAAIKPSVDVRKILKPLYNYKAAEERR